MTACDLASRRTLQAGGLAHRQSARLAGWLLTRLLSPVPLLGGLGSLGAALGSRLADLGVRLFVRAFGVTPDPGNSGVAALVAHCLLVFLF